MNPPILPPLVLPENFASPASTNNNPGCINPADQTYVPVSAEPSKVDRFASALPATSNGEQQRGNQSASPSFNGTVTQTAGSAPVIQRSGDSGQRLDKRTTTNAKSTGKGLAREVFAGSICHAKHSPPPEAIGTGTGLPAEVFPGSASPTMKIAAIVALCTPPAVDVHADTRRSGGLPKNVHIR
jgi:hypothetical protein